MKKNNNTEDKSETDLQDSANDKAKMKQEKRVIDLPDVEDIPGQENIKPAPMGEMADTTISSADEEGDSVFNDNIDEDVQNSPDSNVSQEERDTLRRTFSDLPTRDNENLRRSALDNTDNDGAPLNESSFKNNITGSGLDVPGAESDDDNEKIGGEDEENNEYSLGGDKHD